MHLNSVSQRWLASTTTEETYTIASELYHLLNVCLPNEAEGISSAGGSIPSTIGGPQESSPVPCMLDPELHRNISKCNREIR